MLPAYVETMLAAGDVDATRAAADELTDMATALDMPLLRAIAARSDGAVLLAEGEALAALDKLRQACVAWEQLEAPYETARVRVLIALACRALGDHDTAEMEFDAACWVFQRLGAAADASRIGAMEHDGLFDDSHGLTPRQQEVLRQLAAGKTNKAIAEELFISERTVEHHVSSIFARLEVSSRAAATAYAYEHELV